MRPSGEPTPEHWNAVAWEELDPRHGRRRMRQVLRHVPPNGIHLDVGTGRGDGTLLLSGRVRCVGLEYGTRSAAIAAAQGCTVVRGDARHLPFASGSFDSGTCLDVLEHLPRPEEAISELARVIRAGGILVLETPNSELLKERLLGLLRRLGLRQRQPYDIPLPAASIRALLEKAGWTIEVERPERGWDPRFWIRTISWTRLFLCHKGRRRDELPTGLESVAERQRRAGAP